jgi:hypothetical protein
VFIGRRREGKSTRAVRRKVVLGIMFAIGDVVAGVDAWMELEVEFRD